jgi:L-glyceraldehyde 3-phosphate reductase
MSFVFDAKRYDGAQFRRCGQSGIVLPPVSLGLWQNFGGIDIFETGRAVIRRAFDRGVTHFNLANNYGPPYGSAEENFGEILRKDLRDYRDELIISTKAGWDMARALRRGRFAQVSTGVVRRKPAAHGT